jgi:hypothetical protein
MQGIRSAAALLALSALGGAASGGETLTYPDLVRRLYDLERLAEPPAPDERSGNWSSWDRGARYDAATDRYVKWYANSDGGGFIRREGGAIVAAEMTGPGVIWRIWSAKAVKGHIKFFIDGNPEPALDIPFGQYFNNKEGPFAYPELVHVLSRGNNSFIPIPYHKSCRILLEKGWGAYYQITYTAFPAGTVVPGFTGTFSDADKAALAEANRVFAARGADPKKAVPDAKTESKTLTIGPGKTVEAFALAGPRAIAALKVKPALGPDDNPVRILRELALTITWDDETKPGVWTPLGDFFGTAPGINRYKGLPLGMTDEGFYSYWHMPFATKASIRLTNDGAQARAVAVSVTHAPCEDAGRLLRFHAKWHRDAYPLVDAERYTHGDRWPDWPMLITKGSGRFCGVNLHVWNPNPFGRVRKGLPASVTDSDLPPEILKVMHAAARGWWWGEGDEKFWVDDEKMPSTFGTGSEDYFGYAWAAHNPVEFESALQNQPLNRNSSLGHVSNNRFQIADNVPFRTRFEASMEKYHPNAWPQIHACTAYWYQRAGQADPYGPVPVADRVDYYVEPERPKPVQGMFEGETHLKVVSCEKGTAETQGMRGFGPGWSRDAHLLWKSGEPGAALVLAFDVDETGSYDVMLRMTKALDYGIFRVRLDDRTIVDSMDLYDPKVVPAPPIDAGTVTIDKGRHRLRIEITGANPAARDGRFGKHLLGLDYLKLTKK